MPGDAYQKQLLAREHVNLRSSAEVELWTQVLNVYVSDLVTAVAEVGSNSTAVLKYLLERNLSRRHE